MITIKLTSKQADQLLAALCDAQNYCTAVVQELIVDDSIDETPEDMSAKRDDYDKLERDYRAQLKKLGVLG